MARNAVSYGEEDGRSFLRLPPASIFEFDADLSFPIDSRLAPGVLFTPRAMENKWAIFTHEEKIIFVRSWTREVKVVANFRASNNSVSLHHFTGSFLEDDCDRKLTLRIADFLIRSHVLDEIVPAPLPPGVFEVPYQAALICFSQFGRHAHFASDEPAALPPPTIPLRSHSLLHIGVAMGDRERIREAIELGIPIDLLAADGLATLHWALASEDRSIIPLLIDQGCPVDVRSHQGATPLMNAVQDGDLDHVETLIRLGSDVNAQDFRGFTATHRAAELGHPEILRTLLAAGANPSTDAEGHTPISLAELRKNKEILEILRSALN